MLYRVLHPSRPCWIRLFWKQTSLLEMEMWGLFVRPDSCAGREPRSDEAEMGRRRGRPPRRRTDDDKIIQPSLFTAVLGLTSKGPLHKGLQKRIVGRIGHFQKARLDHLCPSASVDNIYEAPPSHRTCCKVLRGRRKKKAWCLS